MSNPPTSVTLAHGLLAEQAVAIGLANRDYNVGEVITVPQTTAIALQRYGLISDYTIPAEVGPASLERLVQDAVDVAYLVNTQLAASAAVADLLSPAVTAAAGAAVSAAVASAVPPLVNDALDARRFTPQYANVRDYGARGDATSDSGPAIQQALDDARDANGGWVFIPQGTYLLSTLAPLRIYGNTRLTLAPGATLRRDTTGPMLLNGSDSQFLGAYGGESNIVVEGGTFDMQGAAIPDVAAALTFGHADNITVQNVTIKDVPGGNGLDLTAVRGGRVSHCRFRGFVDPDGTHAGQAAVRVGIAKSSTVFPPFAPWDNTACKDITVTGCYFGPSFTPGTTPWGVGVGSDAATVSVWHGDITVTGCLFDGLGRYAVRGYNWEHVAVTANRMDSCGGGILARSIDTSVSADTRDTGGTTTGASQIMRGWTIAANTMVGLAGYDDPIVVYGETTGHVQKIAIVGNVMDHPANQNAIRAAYVDQLTVIGNVMTRPDRSGIILTNCTEFAVSANIIRDTGDHGIACVDCTDGTITDNRMRTIGLNGVYVSNGTDIMIAHNAVKAAGRATNNTYSGIRLVSTTTFTSVVGNQIRPNGSGNEVTAGISITSTCSAIRRYGNGTGGFGVDDNAGSFASAADN